MVGNKYCQILGSLISNLVVGEIQYSDLLVHHSFGQHVDTFISERVVGKVQVSDMGQLVDASHDVVEQGVRDLAVPHTDHGQLGTAGYSRGDVVGVLLCQSEHVPPEVHPTVFSLKAEYQFLQVGEERQDGGKVQVVGGTDHVDLLRSEVDTLWRAGS